MRLFSASLKRFGSRRSKVPGVSLRRVQRLLLEWVGEGGGESLSPRLLVQEHQVVHVPALVAPPADPHRHFAALESLQDLLGRHGSGGRLVAAVPGPQVDGPAADLAHVALALRVAGREARDVLERHVGARQRLLARLHAALQDLEVVQVRAQAAGRHQLPRHRLVQAVEEGLLLRRRLRRRARFQGGRPPGLVTAASGSLCTQPQQTKTTLSIPAGGETGLSILHINTQSHEYIQ